MLVDGRAARQAPHGQRRGAGRGRRAGRRGGARRAAGAPSRSPGRTSTCSSSTSRPASSCTRAPGTAPGTLVQALAGRVAGGDDPERPGVVHRLDRDTSGLLVLARSDEVHADAAGRAAARARSCASTSRSSRAGPAARRGTIDAPLGRDRRVRTRMSTDTDEPREAVTHFEVERNLARRDAAARAAGDRPHAPDPRPPEGDRASGARRPGVRPPAALRAAAAVPARRPARLRRTRSRASALDLRSPLPPDLEAALESAGLQRTAGRPEGPPHRPGRRTDPTGGRGREGRPAEGSNAGASGELA